MTPREEFEKDFYEFVRGLDVFLIVEKTKEKMKVFIEKWAPKDITENSKKNDTSK